MNTAPGTKRNGDAHEWVKLNCWPASARAIQKGTRVLISLWDSLMFGRVPEKARKGFLQIHKNSPGKCNRAILCLILLRFERWDRRQRQGQDGGDGGGNGGPVAKATVPSRPLFARACCLRGARVPPAPAPAPTPTNRRAGGAGRAPAGASLRPVAMPSINRERDRRLGKVSAKLNRRHYKPAGYPFRTRIQPTPSTDLPPLRTAQASTY